MGEKSVGRTVNATTSVATMERRKMMLAVRRLASNIFWMEGGERESYVVVSLSTLVYISIPHMFLFPFK